ncbi:tail fiber protein [Achromobacter phage Motura]|uniref:Tail fiber protein n=1 Tax=Achromobacter phage Motura TaxID=2591403 RepID=A0A514CT36_9CAUD|nr:tail fiber protein [Achromobacter phage Motura]QDH83635.1 tail fiber protein [Achromobacter phage Motura]
MANLFKVYRSSTPGAKPTQGNMPAGRLALNTADERLYFANASGQVVEPRTSYSSLLPTTAHDLNTYLEPGNFYQGTTAIPLTDYNYPIAQQGFLEIYAFGSATVQEYTTRTNPVRRYVRVKTGADTTTWTQWGELTNQELARLLPSSAHNLDDYVSSDAFVQATQGGADAGTNYPVALPGFLEVIANSNTTVLQRYTTFTTNAVTRRCFIRTKGTGSFTTWVELLTNYNGTTYNPFLNTGADLNNVLERGVYQIPTTAIAQSGTNFPAPFSGYMEVYSTAAYGSGIAVTSGVTQVYYAANLNMVFYRSLVTNVWTPWATTSVANQLTTQNLNDVTAPGTYYVNSDATATGALNYPVQVAGVLEVVQAPLGNLQVMQRYTTRSGSGLTPRIFVRNRFTTSLTWYDWVEIGGSSGGGGFGVAQTKQNVTASRSVATNYQNTTSLPIVVYIYAATQATNGYVLITMDSDPAAVAYYPTAGNSIPATLVVPVGSIYRVDVSGAAVVKWQELR